MPNRLEPLDRRQSAHHDVGRLCFADEVGIDFPSVHAVVDRMRDAFLGPSGTEPRVEAHVSISALEALRGHEVTLTLPVRRTCAACGGRGEIWSDACASCRGNGDSLDGHEVQVTVPPGVRDGTRVQLVVAPRHAPVTRVDLQISVR